MIAIGSFFYSALAKGAEPMNVQIRKPRFRDNPLKEISDLKEI